jgi:hypothetical protein
MIYKQAVRSCQNTVELGYNFMKETQYFVWL